MKRWQRVLLIIVGIAGIFSVRIFEEQWFYDPMLAYFKTVDFQSAFPPLDWSRLVPSHILRFLLNLTFSLLLIHGIFGKKQWTKMSAWVIVGVFCIVFPIYLYCLYSEMSIGYLFTFYVRRFVIQPLLLLLLIPILYYLRYQQRQS